MRITNTILYQESLRGLRSNLEAIEAAHRQVSSGLRVEKASDDPASAAGAMRASDALRALEQHSRNASTGRARLAAEEAVLEQVTDVMVRAKELGIAQAGSPADASTRAITAAEVSELLDHVRDLGNTELGGSYLFGGAWADTRPFPDAGPDPSRPAAGERLVEIGAGSQVPTNHDGQTVFQDSGVFAALEALEAGLRADDADAVRNAIGDVDTAFTRVQELTAEVGARSRRLDVAVANLEALDVNLRSLRSELQDADIEEAVTQLVNRQTGYQAALLANARILQTTLTDYLR